MREGDSSGGSGTPERPIQAGGEEIAALAGTLESILFVADRPVPADRLAEVTGVEAQEVRSAIVLLQSRVGGLVVQSVAGGYQLGTRPEHAEAVRLFLQREHAEPLSRGALETLAIVAYRQPVTRAEIEQIRGVSSDWHVERLLDRRLIRVVGRRQTVGRPVLFGTTETFLRYFGLNDLSGLPAMGVKGVQSLLEPLG